MVKQRQKRHRKGFQKVPMKLIKKNGVIKSYISWWLKTTSAKISFAVLMPQGYSFSINRGYFQVLRSNINLEILTILCLKTITDLIHNSAKNYCQIIFSKIHKELNNLWKSCNFYFSLELKHSYFGNTHSRMFTLGIYFGFNSSHLYSKPICHTSSFTSASRVKSILIKHIRYYFSPGRVW